MKPAKKTQRSSGSGRIAPNKVHQLVEYIEDCFGKEGRTNRDFAAAALAGTLRFLKEISEADGIDTKNKIETLTKIYQAANQRIGELLDVKPSVPLWAARTEWRMSPCRFVELYYPTYGKGLTTDDISDRKLLRALWNYKNRYGWPEGFSLPNKSAALDILIKKQGADVNLKGLADAPPSIRRHRKRVWQAHHRRVNK